MKHYFMPKQSKTKVQSKTKSQTKIKSKAQPVTPGITTKKWYWVMLAGVMVTVFSIIGSTMGLKLPEIAILMLTIALLIGLMGYVKITPSNLSVSKRATFLFIGASFIGFSIWVAIVLIATNAGFIESIFVDTFFVIPSLIICLIIGAFIGELLGKNSRIQTFLFKPENTI
jgi:hypothetical protein